MGGRKMCRGRACVWAGCMGPSSPGRVRAARVKSVEPPPLLCRCQKCQATAAALSVVHARAPTRRPIPCTAPPSPPRPLPRSGDTPGSRGCLLELTWAGRDELELRAERRQGEELEGGAAAEGPRAGAGGVGEEAGGGAGAGGELLGRRRYLEDGDTVVLRGWCGGGGGKRIGFGRCEGKLLPCR